MLRRGQARKLAAARSPVWKKNETRLKVYDLRIKREYWLSEGSAFYFHIGMNQVF